MLPKIDVPVFTVELPSNKKKVDFRPFLVKEQKLFLMMAESTDPAETIKVIRQVLKNCVLIDLDIDALPVFDLEYLFMNLRARSVSEMVNLKYRCNNMVGEEGSQKECGTINEINFNVLEIQPTYTKEHTNKIQLSDKIGIIMKYPTFELVQKATGKGEDEMIMDMIYETIECVYDENQIYHMKDNTKEEIIEFVDNLQQKDLDMFEADVERARGVKDRADKTLDLIISNAIKVETDEAEIARPFSMPFEKRGGETVPFFRKPAGRADVKGLEAISEENEKKKMEDIMLQASTPQAKDNAIKVTSAQKAKSLYGTRDFDNLLKSDVGSAVSDLYVANKSKGEESTGQILEYIATEFPKVEDQEKAATVLFGLQYGDLRSKKLG